MLNFFPAIVEPEPILWAFSDPALQLGIVGRCPFSLVHGQAGKHPLQGLLVGHLLAEFEVYHYKAYLPIRGFAVRIPAIA